MILQSFVESRILAVFIYFFIFQETAVSTAHFAQGNTIEYEMAMEWRLLQTRSEVTWSELYKVRR